MRQLPIPPPNASCCARITTAPQVPTHRRASLREHPASRAVAAPHSLVSPDPDLNCQPAATHPRRAREVSVDAPLALNAPVPRRSAFASAQNSRDLRLKPNPCALRTPPRLHSNAARVTLDIQRRRSVPFPLPQPQLSTFRPTQNAPTPRTKAPRKPGNFLARPRRSRANPVPAIATLVSKLTRARAISPHPRRLEPRRNTARKKSRTRVHAQAELAHIPLHTASADTQQRGIGP
ncbi:hypothetical protein B0H16DRAFT_1525549 [Mycena metata]|uniref:Uncharacterized protein n=1 Tax=Mycena metata TaxID=1033252 RepID=A0AAD7JIQ3_9AGAR|nr:hypothetical protein B0H16DRAFT_1525549 [Mycena metata]